MSGLERRWQQRWDAGQALQKRTVRFEERVPLRHAPAAVWELVTSPERMPDLAPAEVARAFAVPGTPDGVGQQLCLIAPDGATSLYAVVERIEGSRAVVRLLSPKPACDIRGIHELLPDDGGCVLVLVFEADLQEPHRLQPGFEAQWRSQMADYARRVRAALDGAAGPAPEYRPDPAQDDWAVPLDDAFVAAAAVREQPGAVRAAAARRITADHARAQPWRAPGEALPVRRRRSHLRAVATGLAAMVISVAVLMGAAELQERRPGSGVFTAQSGPTGPVVPRPPDAQDTRLRPLVAPPPGEGGWTPIAVHDGRPVGFDPCRPVHWVMRPDGAPADGKGLLDEGLARLADATGLEFVHDGPTDEDYADDRPLVQLDRYGNRYAPVLVVWSDEDETKGLAGDVGGFAGAATVDPDGAGPRQVSGVVVLDSPQLADLPGGRDARLGVVLHELGHLAGLDHVDDPADSMYEASGPATAYTAGARRGLAVVGAAPCFVS